jgi:hypothetical protein
MSLSKRQRRNSGGNGTAVATAEATPKAAGSSGATPKNRELDLRTRYGCASNEINQRINARQISYLGYAVAVAATMNLIAQLCPRPSEDIKPASPEVGHAFAIASVLAPGVVSFAFGCWIRAHDLTVGVLGLFCRHCEQIERNAFTKAGLPDWPSDAWQKTPMRHREFIEIAFILLNVLAVECADVFGYSLQWMRNSHAGLLIISINHFVLGLSLWMILSIKEHRQWLMMVGFDDDSRPRFGSYGLRPRDFFFCIAVCGIAVGIVDVLRPDILSKTQPRIIPAAAMISATITAASWYVQKWRCRDDLRPGRRQHTLHALLHAGRESLPMDGRILWPLCQRRVSVRLSPASASWYRLVRAHATRGHRTSLCRTGTGAREAGDLRRALQLDCVRP